MKFLSMVFMETQQEFFGKAGIPWHGGMALMKLVPTGGEDDDGDCAVDDYTIVFFDFITDSKKEDGFAVLTMVEGNIRILIYIYIYSLSFVNLLLPSCCYLLM